MLARCPRQERLGVLVDEPHPGALSGMLVLLPAFPTVKVGWLCRMLQAAQADRLMPVICGKGMSDAVRRMMDRRFQRVSVFL